jgi:hypothetical protein
VGFNELMAKALKHSGKKTRVVTNIWRVFAILLENTCKADYRLLINEIMISNKTDMEDLEA